MDNIPNELIWIQVKKEYKKKAGSKLTNVEKQFQKDIASHLTLLWYKRFHVPDIWLWTKLLDEVVFAPDGRIYCIEFKQVDWYTFNLSKFEPSQIILLEYMMRHNNPCYIMIYSQKTGTYWVGTYRYLKESQNEKWWIHLFTKQ
jgi:hypothetical protein